jgi:hypothetical protein
MILKPVKMKKKLIHKYLEFKSWLSEEEGVHALNTHLEGLPEDQIRYAQVKAEKVLFEQFKKNKLNEVKDSKRLQEEWTSEAKKLKYGLKFIYI